MFTGIIQAIGEIHSVESGEEAARIRLRLPEGFGPLETGESLAVDGACLTAAPGAVAAPAHFLADVSWETLERTTLGGKSAGEAVNLERALRPSDRLGGHFVTGHVDGVGTIVRLEARASSWDLAIAAPPQVMQLCVEKGSIAVDGISLTVATLSESGFTCAVIPHTLNQTTLGRRRAGDRVNLEGDLIGKYVRRFMMRGEGQKPALTWEDLARAGFIEH